MTDICELSARDLAAAIRARRIGAREAVEATLARLAAQSRLNAFMAICGERARAEADAIDARLARGDTLGPLAGLPFSVKDLTLTEGVTTTQGSALFADAIPKEDAVAVARARAAGAILIGKTTSPEFGHKAFTEGPLFGRTLNPWSAAHTCGGSSGGAAAALAAGVGPLALGSDGGGSIRIPAACCGVVGLKASLGAIPNLQAPDLFGANSYVGPMARDVADTRLFFETLAGPDRRDPYGQAPLRDIEPVAQPRVALLLRCGAPLDAEVERAVVATMGAAERIGFVIEPIERDFVALERHFLTILRATLAARLGAAARATPEKLDPTLRITIAQGLDIGAVEVAEAQFARTRCFADMQALFMRYDLIASPTLTAPALPVDMDPHGRFTIAGEDAGTIRGAWYPYTYPFNLTGHPALSMPCGFSSNGLPIGLQLVGPWGGDRALLDAAARLEAEIGPAPRPPLA